MDLKEMVAALSAALAGAVLWLSRKNVNDTKEKLREEMDKKMSSLKADTEKDYCALKREMERDMQTLKTDLREEINHAVKRCEDLLEEQITITENERQRHERFMNEMRRTVGEINEREMVCKASMPERFMTIKAFNESVAGQLKSYMDTLQAAQSQVMTAIGALADVQNEHKALVSRVTILEKTTDRRAS